MTDRPLSRRIVKLAALLSGPSRAHRQDLWPHLMIDRSSGAVTWKRAPLLTLRRVSDIVPAGRDLLAVIGSGPSLRAQHPERLPDASAILLNGAASLTGRLRPLAIAVEDERFVFRHHAMLAGLPDDVPFLLSPAALRAIAERNPRTLTTRAIALIANLAKPVNGPRRPLTDPALDDCLIWGATARTRNAALSRDPDSGVVISGTVALTGLQIALAARPRRILLAGIDLTNADTPRFYESAQDRAPSGLVAGLDRSLAGFAVAQQIAQDADIVLDCASPVSALLDIGIPYSDSLA